ncbi:AraC family transcriptional regulator [Sandaracinobacteroides hominis]|uniref:AraC family transcriptional regulator n=1 Tax=Sandaracinobacteroides hominis TaxID=2780086 RepID=UPI0018F4EC27|nr:helix-turn-helix transcriptional regulator [Sandaracinobacteroides hominis]
MGSDVEDFQSYPSVRQLQDIRRTGPGVGWEVEHHHEELEFNLIISGRGAYFLEDNHFELKPGTLVWILPDQRHRLMRGPDLDMWVGSLSSAYVSPEILQLAARNPLKSLSAEDAIALDRLYSHLSQDADQPDVYRLGLQYALRSTMHIACTSAGPPPAIRHPAVTQALGLLRRSDDEIVNMPALAAKCGVSAKYLGDLLMAQTGRGFVEWRNIARLERFQDAYPESGDLLTGALAAGFGSYTQFHRVFQLYVGTTPGDWARKRDDKARLAFPQMSHSADQMTSGSQRLIWYKLLDASFVESDRWLADIVGNGLIAPSGSQAADEPIPTGLESYESLRDLQPALTAELCRNIPESAERIRETFARYDLFDLYEERFTHFGADIRDLSSLATILLIVLSMEANHLAMPSPADAARLRTAVRRTGAAAHKISAEGRRRIAAGILVQTLVLVMGSLGARGSGMAAKAVRIADAAQGYGLQKLGIDLRQTPLFGPRSPLATMPASGNWGAT